MYYLRLDNLVRAVPTRARPEPTPAISEMSPPVIGSLPRDTEIPKTSVGIVVDVDVDVVVTVTGTVVDVVEVVDVDVDVVVTGTVVDVVIVVDVVDDEVVAGLQNESAGLPCAMPELPSHS